MRYTTFACLASAALLLLPLESRAQRPKLKIDQVKVGFLSGPQAGEFKSGAWAPVHIDITAPPDGRREADVSVDSSDGDDVRNSSRVPLGALAPNERIPLMGYTRPGSTHGELAVKVKVGPYDYEHKEHHAAMGLGSV